MSQAPPPGWQPPPEQPEAGYPGADQAAPGHSGAAYPAPAYPGAAYPGAAYPVAAQPGAAYPGAGPYAGPYGGQQPAWGAPAHKPGIVALRPLTLSDIYDGSFKAIRRNPKAMIGLSLVVQAAVLAIPAVVGMLLAFAGRLSSSASSGTGANEAEIGSVVRQLVQLVGSLLSSLATVVLAGIIVAIVFRAVLGRRTTPGEAWRHVRGRVLALIGLSLLVGVCIMIPGVVVVLLVVLAAVAGSAAGAVLIALFGGLGWIALALFLMVKWRFATPVLVLEGLGVVAAMRRSWQLSRGAFWRILGISLLTSLIVGIAAGLLGVPFQIPEMIRTFAAPENSGLAGITLLIVFVGMVLAAAVTAPFTASVAVLLYLDQRIRSEGYDVELIAASDPAAHDAGLESGRPLAPVSRMPTPTRSGQAW